MDIAIAGGIVAFIEKMFCAVAASVLTASHKPAVLV
jgi:hypothetical protein